MSLDSRYMIASDLQSLFRDKDTGLPLRNGVIYFWADQSRTTPKSVFKISGTPPNYTYTDLGAVIDLTSSGTISDNGPNDIILYYFPFDDNGNVELYFVQVYSEGGITDGVLQFTREGWPNFSASETTQDLENFVPNGQFLIHTDIPATDTTVVGQITEASTILSQGGWSFDRPNASSATDIVTFTPFDSAVSNPPANPKFALTVENQVPGSGDTFKDIRLKFPDVNKFASTTQQYTYGFYAQSNTASTITVQLILIKNFGTDGDPQTETPITFLTVPVSYGVVSASFTFGTNIGKTIGPDEDDYLQLAIRLPLNSVFSASFTDFILTPNAVNITDFPQTPDNEFIYQSIAGWMPTPRHDGSDLYLPLRLSPAGMIFDRGEIGNVVYESNMVNYTGNFSTITNNLLANGAKYETISYSPLGIPMARLQEFYFNSTIGIPTYGTGLDYFTGVWLNNTNEVTIANNTNGIVAAASNGSPSTGFTIDSWYPGSTGFFCDSSMATANSFFIFNQVVGDVPSPTAGTSGFNIVTWQVGDANQPLISEISTLPASGLAGLFFQFDTSHSGDQPYYVWFEVSGTGSDPAIGGRTPIKCVLNTADTDAIVAQKIALLLNGFGITSVQTTAASTVPTGSFFNISATGNNYYVWYKKDGTGTDPKPSGKIAIQVDILTADTAPQVAQKTQLAINKKFFAVPNYEDYFLRGWSYVNANDPSQLRYSPVPQVFGEALGTFQYNQNFMHVHAIGGPSTTINNQGGGVLRDQAGTGVFDLGAGTTFQVATLTATTAASIGVQGATESRPNNALVSYAIKY
jgi:hypothetical protein